MKNEFQKNGFIYFILTRNEAGEDALNFVLTDHLGSVQILTNKQGTLLEEYSYDAWGLRRDPESLETFESDIKDKTDYGFTGHEHLDAFALVNMNGPMYDPVLGRFLSPDPVLQFPDFTQGLNPYSYALNNLLKYTDHSGYSLVGNLIAIGASIILAPMPMLAVLAYSVVMTIDYAIENGRNVNASQIGAYFIQSVVWSTLSMGTSKAIGDLFGHGKPGKLLKELGRATAHGITNGAMRMIQGGKFEHGFLSGFVSSLGGSFMQAYGENMSTGTQVALSAAIGGTAEALGGGKFANGAVTGAYVGLFNHAMHNSEDDPLKNEQVNNNPYSSYGKEASEAYSSGYKIGYQFGVNGQRYKFGLHKILTAVQNINEYNEADVIMKFGKTAVPRLDGLNDGFRIGYNIYKQNTRLPQIEFNFDVIKNMWKSIWKGNFQFKGNHPPIKYEFEK